MKKLLVLSALLGLLVLPVFADHVSIDFGGDDTYGFISDFGSGVAEKLDLTWDVIVGIDDYNSFTWSTAGLTGGFTALDKALVTTDLGMWLGLPVGWKVMWGYDDPANNMFQSVSGYANEEINDFSPDMYWGLANMLSFGMIDLHVAFDPDVENGGSLLAGLAFNEPVDGLNAEVYYFQNQSSSDVFDQGLITFDAGYSTEVSGIGLDAGAAFLYNLADTGDAWGYGIGLAAAVSMFDITLGLDGNESDALNALTATVDAAPFDMASVYAGLKLSFSDTDDPTTTTTDETEAFQGADIGVNAHVGAVECYLGYLITSEDAGDYNAPVTLQDGGIYVKFDVNY
jgi:hypothetical protein